MKNPPSKSGAVPVRTAAALAMLSLLLASCSPGSRTVPLPAVPRVDPSIVQMYGAVVDGDVVVPAIDATKIDPRNIRQVVDYQTSAPPGTIVVDPTARFLFLVMENGKAMRYGVGVAKAGLEFQGEARIGRKAEWPGWRPTTNMVQRDPERYGPLADGLDGGLKNPLGARALYLYRNGEDTLYRIHGTNEPWSIGSSVSSGCIRLMNQDIIDLHRRVPTGSRVVVLSPEQSRTGED